MNLQDLENFKPLCHITKKTPTNKMGTKLPCKFSFYGMKTWLYFIIALFRKRKAFLIQFWRTSLPPVPIKTLDWIILVKREQRSNITSDLLDCPFLKIFSLWLCMSTLLFVFSSDLKNFHLSQYVCTQSALFSFFNWEIQAERPCPVCHCGCCRACVSIRASWLTFKPLEISGVSWEVAEPSVLKPPRETMSVVY